MMGLQFIQMIHADYCPSIMDQNSWSCICNPEISTVSESVWRAGLAQTRKERREAERQAEKLIRKMKGKL
jgi:hypothetical protein